MKSSGQSLFDEVVRKLRLVESDYFDLEYTDVRGAAVSIYRTSFFYRRSRDVPISHEK